MDEADLRWKPGDRVTEAEALEMLDALYAQLPAIECRGRCWDSCTDVDASELERRRLAERGVHFSDIPALQRLRAHRTIGKQPGRCPALTSWNTCRVYELRPFTCRAFGMVLEPGTPLAMTFRSAMMCDHGCVPDATITVADYVKLLDRIELLSRAVTGVVRHDTLQERMDAMARPGRKRKRTS